MDFDFSVNGLFLDYTERFDADTIQNVMSVLSRGIAVTASMNTRVSSRA